MATSEMSCPPHFTPSSLFTEADLVWDTQSAPPTCIDLRLVKTHEEDTSHDILADLEAVTPRQQAVQLSPLSDFSLEASPSQQDMMGTHFDRRRHVQHQHSRTAHEATTIHAIDWPCLTRLPPRSFQVKTELSSPTDIAYGSFIPSNTPLVSISAMSAKEEVSLPIDDGRVLFPRSLNRVPTTPLAKKKRISKSRRSRQNATPQPSRFCHICARTQKSRKMFCANLNTEKKCRKAVCEPCFKELRWNFEKALEGREKWHCPHCRGMCESVPRARCHIYTKTNEKRKASKRL